MTPSLIRCLLAVLALSETYDAVASKDVAQLLGVKRPTVHRSLGILQTRGLIHKEPYGDVHLTEAGRQLAEQMETQRDDLAIRLSKDYGLEPDECARAAVVLIGELSAESLARICAPRVST